MPESRPQRGDLPFGQVTTQTKGPNTDVLSPKGVPSRSQPSPLPVSVDPLAANPPRPPQSLRLPSRLVTDPQNRAEQRPQMRQSAPPSFPVSPLREGDQSVDRRPLLPGTLIRNGRYRLHEMLERQEWSSEAYEVMWLAQDAQRSGAQVAICELAIPNSKSMMVQSMLRSATMALTSVGRNQHIPTLWDAFNDQGRNFFVFEFIEGEALLARVRRTGRPLSEQEVIECCLQMTEVLELLSQQSPPLVHGQIRPEHIVRRSGSQYVLTNFSIVLAGSAVQLVSGADRSRLSPYTAPEFTRGVIDGRSDLYSLLATAYHLITGSVPTSMNGTIPQAQRLNPNVSPQFDAILMRGLSPVAIQRYQRPAELRQELLSIPSTTGSHIVKSGSLSYGGQAEQPMSLASSPSQPAPDIATQLLPGTLAPATEYTQDQEHRTLLPRPEELSPMSQGNDLQQAAFWLVGLLVCLIAVVVLSRGFF